MAWIDDRLWAHHKFAALSDRAWRIGVSAILYSHGFGLYGRLEQYHQRVIGSTPKIRRELVTAGLWEDDGDAILIHDWEAHNAKHDARKAADRERKRKEREAKKAEKESAGRPADAPQDAPRDVHGTDTPGPARAHAGARAGAGPAPMTSDYVQGQEQNPVPEPAPEVRDVEPNGAGAGAADEHAQPWNRLADRLLKEIQ